MESVLSRLRDTVSATVYQVTNNLSTALPGNPLTREYELVRQIGSAGPCLLFKIYEAVKKSTKENASLFILEKKALDKYPKKEKELLLEAIRHGVPQLTRLRHPSMLTIQHSLEESRDLIAFATEPVIGSLANFFDPDSPVKTEDGGKFEFFDVEIKYGLLQISEGLLFLHKDAKLLHRNICPENIIVNRNGIWKISGFDFSVQTFTPNEHPLKFTPIKVMPEVSLDIQANFTYGAPENFDNSSHIDTSSDIFSLGMLTYTLYNQGKPLLRFDSSYQYRPEKYASDLRDKLSSSLVLSSIPEDSRKHFKLLLSSDTSLRPDAQQISKLSIFQDVLVRTLQYFDSLFQWDNTQKAQFYKSLPEILTKIPKRVKLRRIVTGLAKEFVNPEMVPFVLPNLFLIAKETTDEEFHTWIVPDLVPVFKYKEPIQIGIFLLQNMDFLVDKFKTNPDSLREHIIPLIYRFLESDAYQIQELCLSVVPSIIHLIDYSGSKNMLLPRIKKLALGTKLLSVRVNCLLCLGKIVESLDKWLVLDEVLPLIMQMPSREPAVIMASVGILKLTLNSNKLGITKEALATKVIPFLVPLSIENGLSLQQYTTVMSLVREILSKIEEEHQAKLQQLESVKVKQESFFSESNISSDKAKLPFDPFGLNTSESAPTGGVAHLTKSTNSLSLDEKERMAFEKEQSERLNREMTLVPQTKQTPTSTSSQPARDLTSTLFDSNLSMLSRPAVVGNGISQPTRTDYVFANATTINGFSSAPMSPNLSTGLNRANMPRPNLSALDNLRIPDINQRGPNQTLNSMKQGITHSMNMNTPLRMSSPGTSNLAINASSQQQTKQLSQRELEEFLN